VHTFCRRRSLYAYKRTAALWLLNDSSIEKIVFNTSNNNRPQSSIFELIGISNQDLKNQKKNCCCINKSFKSAKCLKATHLWKVPVLRST